MKCLYLLIVSIVVAVTAAADSAHHSIFNATVMSGYVGDTPVTLYLAPSPYISKGVEDFIDSATNTLDICIYEVNLPEVFEKVLAAVQRGVKVRMSVSPASVPGTGDKELRKLFSRLKSRKILRVTGNRSGLMHNKFMVADGHAVWTGSYNFTKNDTEMNDNNAVMFSNKLLAENYIAEMDEVWTGMHGKRNSTPTPHPIIRMGDVTIRSYFSPEDDVEGAFVAEILKATNTIYIMAFALTDRAMFKAITDRIEAGVSVYVLLDLTLSRHGSSLRNSLREVGATVRISSNNGRMHHKVMVLDETVVVTGSANFSASALNVNDENIVVFDCPALARAFVTEFTRCWLAKPYIWNKWSQQVGR